MKLLVGIFIVLIVLFILLLFKEIKKEIVVGKNLSQYIKSKLFRIIVSASIVSLLLTNNAKLDVNYLLRIISSIIVYTLLILVIYTVTFILIKKNSVLRKNKK